jgi:hypothetical protein
MPWISGSLIGPRNSRFYYSVSSEAMRRTAKGRRKWNRRIVVSDQITEIRRTISTLNEIYIDGHQAIVKTFSSVADLDLKCELMYQFCRIRDFLANLAQMLTTSQPDSSELEDQYWRAFRAHNTIQALRRIARVS